MLYRENGQFKTSYRADQQIFPLTAHGLPLTFFECALRDSNPQPFDP